MILRVGSKNRFVLLSDEFDAAFVPIISSNDKKKVQQRHFVAHMAMDIIFIRD
jgi:hypothetical protein